MHGAQRDTLTTALAAAVLVMGGLTVLAAVVDAPALLTGAVALVLVAVATAFGRRLGGARLRELQREVQLSSSELRRALAELETAQAETVRRLSMAVEFRDEDTGAHIERIGRFSRLLALQAGREDEFCERLHHAAPLHDVGKVAIPDAILLKPGPLTPDERAIVETHAEEGHRLLRGSTSRILDLAASIALSHHEKWDGTGYPRGLAGEEIPVEGRIVAIADVFDALTSDRVYRRAFTVEQAVEMMREQRGRHFDPQLLDAFLEVLGHSGPDGREQRGADPRAALAEVRDLYTRALARGDAEAAESAIAQAIDDGLGAAELHGDVIAPALRTIGELLQRGELDLDGERRAMVITRRILATMYRYMLGGDGPGQESVLARLDESVQALEEQLAMREHAVG